PWDALNSLTPLQAAQDFELAERNPRLLANFTALDFRAAASLPAVGPSTRLLNPKTARFPRNGTKTTSRSSPGSNRMAVDDGMLRGRQTAAARSNSRARLTSKK